MQVFKETSKFLEITCYVVSPQSKLQFGADPLILPRSPNLWTWNTPFSTKTSTNG